MQRREISFTGDVCDEAYHELIDAARTLGGTALLVERPSLGMSRRGKDVLDNLQAVFIGEKKQSEWPGTKLLDEDATVRFYTLNDFFADAVKRAVDCIYEWVQPTLPEDLCFFRPDGTPFLVSVSHEREGYLLISKEDEELVRRFPELDSRLSWQVA